MDGAQRTGVNTVNSVRNPSTRRVLIARPNGIRISDLRVLFFIFLVYQLHSVVQMSGWKGGLDPG